MKLLRRGWLAVTLFALPVSSPAAEAERSLAAGVAAEMNMARTALSVQSASPVAPTSVSGRCASWTLRRRSGHDGNEKYFRIKC